MIGFIEVTIDGIPTTININSILRITPKQNGVYKCEIITKELISRFECSGDNMSLFVSEEYEHVRQLIKEATELK